ncbi:Protein ENHANCED DISEASE RESISTANCE 2, partial [Bienertia sinuspersici]
MGKNSRTFGSKLLNRKTEQKITARSHRRQLQCQNKGNNKTNMQVFIWYTTTMDAVHIHPDLRKCHSADMPFQYQ